MYMDKENQNLIILFKSVLADLNIVKYIPVLIAADFFNILNKNSEMAQSVKLNFSFYCLKGHNKNVNYS